MRVDNQPAYILHQRPFRDTSQILEVFTKDFGRLSIMSRGSRGPKSRLKNIIQPFRALVVSWSGRGEMPTLTGAETASQSVAFLQGKSLACALYINELIMYLTYKHDVHDLLFSQYHHTVNCLIETDKLEQVLRQFEFNMLENLGVSLDLTHDAKTGNKLNEGAEYFFQLESGFSELNRSSDAPGCPVVSGSSLLEISQGRFETEKTLKDAKHLMRYIISHYLGGKSLKSRELFR